MMANTRRLLCRASAAWLATTAFAAHAQSGPNIQLDFSGPSAVPLSPGLAAVIAVALAVVAFIALRRSRRAGAISGLLLVAAMTAFAPGVPQFVGSAYGAVMATPLSTSPTVLPIMGAGTFYFQDATASPIIFSSVRLNNPGALTIDTVNSTCKAGTTLQPNAICTAIVIGTPDVT